MAAAFMADVTGRLTGVPGVALATVGPGATNLTTGVGNALLDRSPALIITGQVPLAQLGRRVQMHIDHRALMRPLTKGSFLLEPGTVADTVDRALGLATGEPPGPVHLDVPEDVAVARPGEPPSPLVRPGPEVARKVTGLAQGLDILRQARRPVVALGLSAARLGIGSLVRRFVERHSVPFVSTMMGKGVLPDEHRLCIGVLGRARHRRVEEYLAGADLVIGIGYDPVEIGYEDWMPKVPLVHVDREGLDADPPVKVAVEVRGDLRVILPELAKATLPRYAWDLEGLRAFRADLLQSLRPAGRRFQPHQVLDLLRAWLPEDGILACDVGAHTHLVATQWPIADRENLLASNGWSSMGYAIPAAMAAKLARPDREVVGLMGDGGFLMLAGEMATAARLGLKILFVVLRDGSLSLIEAKQRQRDYRVVGVALHERWAWTATSYFGVPCIPARSPRAFRSALSRAARLRGPLIIEAHVDGTKYQELLYH
jgi:acetolactate synthase-1/2/3 large subunit